MITKKIIKYKFRRYNSIGREECIAANKVIKSGRLSGFLAGTTAEFQGGKYVKLFEKRLRKYFNVKHAITTNSWTSGLVASIYALNLKKNDEIIVPTWTMSACLAAILSGGAKPVICDVDIDDFTIDINQIEKNISKKTTAILAVDIFGMPCNYEKIIRIAKKFSLKIISDSAQAIGAKYGKKFTSTMSDIGGFSLNRHKHINTGEGGILITNNTLYARKLKLIRNHAESSVKKNEESSIKKIIGQNYRLGEIEAAIGIEQLKKLKRIISKRRSDARKIYNGIKKLKGLKIPDQEYISKSVFYILPMKIDLKIINVSRNKIINKLKLLGMQGIIGSYSSLHLLPIVKLNKYKTDCKNADTLNSKLFLGFLICLYDLSSKDIFKIISCFKKTWQDLKISSND